MTMRWRRAWDRVAAALLTIWAARRVERVKRRLARRYGSVDVDRWFALGLHPDHRVLCDGVDITSDCVWFDDQRGEARVYVRGQDGHYRIDVDRHRIASVATRTLRGEMRVVRHRPKVV